MSYDIFYIINQKGIVKEAKSNKWKGLEWK